MSELLTQSGDDWIGQSGVDLLLQSTVSTATDWPSTLPQKFLLDTYSQQFPATTIRTQPEAGPAIIRRRNSAGVTLFGGEMIFTQAQRETFAVFWNDTALQGAAEFTFPGQDGDGSDWLVRFVGEPEFRRAAAHWRVSLSMEKLP